MMLRPDELDTTHDVILDARLRPTEWSIAAAHRCNALACLGGRPPELSHDGRVVLYSDSPAIAQALVEHLHRCGYPAAAVLEGGFESWWDLGMPCALT